jgi:hypothetical protein
LKFVTGHPDLYRLTQSQIEDIGGVYSAPLQELFLRGVAVTPALRVTLAHELTHALDDEHFGLRGLPRVDDHAYAYAALAEGDAVVVANRYLASRPPAEQKAIGVIDLARLPAVRAATAAIPPTLLRIIQFPYGAGPAFVNALIAAGGKARLDAAFRHPPQTTAEILVRPGTSIRLRAERVPRRRRRVGPCFSGGASVRSACYFCSNRCSRQGKRDPRPPDGAMTPTWPGTTTG